MEPPHLGFSARCLNPQSLIAICHACRPAQGDRRADSWHAAGAARVGPCSRGRRRLLGRRRHVRCQGDPQLPTQERRGDPAVKTLSVPAARCVSFAFVGSSMRRPCLATVFTRSSSQCRTLRRPPARTASRSSCQARCGQRWASGAPARWSRRRGLCCCCLVRVSSGEAAPTAAFPQGMTWLDRTSMQSAPRRCFTSQRWILIHLYAHPGCGVECRR